MNKKTKNCRLTGWQKKEYALMFATMAIFFAMSFVFSNVGKAENSISDIDKADEDSDKETRKKIEELQKRAEVYRQIIDIKQKQSQTLNSQLAIADSNMEKVETEIELNKQKIDDYNSQITRISNQIKEKEALMALQKEILSNLIRSYYEVNLASPIISYLADGNIASFMVTKDRLSQTGDKVSELLSSVREMKSDLEKQNVEIDQKKIGLVNAHEDLQSKSFDLVSLKKQKETLLAETKGEEAKYTKLLQRVEEQKQELLDIDQYFAASGLSVDSYPKPDSKYFASTSWYFSQRDPKWGNENIGNTKTLMKSYGCAVTAVAMVFKENGGSITPGQLANQPIFSGDLINWPTSWTSPKVSLTSAGKSHGNINWSTIDSQLSKKNPVIIYISRTKGGGHYVVIHHKTSDGKYVVHDPYFGPNLFLDTSRALVGAMGANSSTKMDQMIIYN